MGYHAIRGIVYMIFAIFNRVLRMERAITDGDPTVFPSKSELRREGRDIIEQGMIADARATRAAIADPSLEEVTDFVDVDGDGLDDRTGESR